MNKQVLLIDDDFDEQDIFNEAIIASKQAVKCFFANNAKQGLELLEIILPDFIFLDINLPGMNGLECLAEIKKKDDLKNTPVIMYSTGIDETTTKSAIKLGASTCIKKQYSVNALAEKLKQLLNYSNIQS